MRCIITTSREDWHASARSSHVGQEVVPEIADGGVVARALGWHGRVEHGIPHIGVTSAPRATRPRHTPRRARTRARDDTRCFSARPVGETTRTNAPPRAHTPRGERRARDLPPTAPMIPGARRCGRADRGRQASDKSEEGPQPRAGAQGAQWRTGRAVAHRARGGAQGARRRTNRAVAHKARGGVQGAR